MQIYVVQRGDTLWQIAAQYGVGLDQIISTNGLTNPGSLVVGQALVIPTPQSNTYVVQPGDTLWRIAAHYGVSVNAILQENHLTDPNRIIPGQLLRIPKLEIEVNGYLIQMGEAGRQTAINYSRYLTYMSTFSYHIQADGSLIPLDEGDILQLQKANRCSPVLTITNFRGNKFDSDMVHDFLSNTGAQDTLINNVLNVMKTKGYTGLNVDFEYIYPKDRELYNAFLRRIVPRIHSAGYLFSTAIAPKIRADQPGLLYPAHDYPVHGELDDFVVIMTYEWGWAGGPPLAISPVNEVRKVLNYAVTQIPSHKIMMGMPLYGRDWKLPYVAGQSLAATISPPEAINRALKYHAAIQYDTLYQAPYFRYTDENNAIHEVWFEDARSMQAKYNLVFEYGLRGVSYWELSSNFPQNWPVLEANFRIKKLI
ncbi:MAG: LysM peptidoglycan-binding domain-containing protein [Bacillota bacterium]|nr:LysM peptidoglycan-binding domain-containing protein [Bacillota bacterium]